VDQWRADLLDRVEDEALPGYLRNRIRMRRAVMWSSLAFQLACKGEAADSAGKRATGELAGIDKPELAHEDARAYREAATRVGVSRWAAASAAAPSPSAAPPIASLPCPARRARPAFCSSMRSAAFATRSRGAAPTASSEPARRA
jgi:hypothetical protein